MKAPLTTAAFQQVGVKFGSFREKTAAGSIERRGILSIRGSEDHQALLSWLLSHRDEWPATWDDAAVAARLPQILRDYVPQLAAPRAARDKPAYQTILRAAQAALFA